MQSCAEEDGGGDFQCQSIFSSSNAERQAESLELKVLSLFGLEIGKDLYLHQLQPVSLCNSTDPLMDSSSDFR
jgi:hypothetical protein